MAKTAFASKETNTNRTPRERIAAVLPPRFALRFHTSILLRWMFSAGLLTTKDLFALGALINAAFNAMLAGGLIKAGKKVSDPDWFGSVIKATWIPLAMVLVIAWIFTFAAALLTPKAHTFGAVWPLLLESL